MPKRKLVIREIEKTIEKMYDLYSDYCNMDNPQPLQDQKVMSKMIVEVQALKRRYQTPAEVDWELNKHDD